jgi:monoterpene epsilon-lactone hydrolase
MNTPSVALPSYVRLVRHAGSRWRLWWMDKLLRVAVKRAFRYDAEIPFLRDRQDRLDLKLTKVDPEMQAQPVDCNGAAAEWLTLPESRGDKVIFYIHGGAWMFKFPRLHHAMVASWCRRIRARALMVDYRLAPEFRFPAGIDDVWAAWQWLMALGIPPRDVIIGGDSAGGNLTLALLHRIKAAGQPMPACAVMLSPFVDFTLSSPSMVTNEKRDPMFSTSAMVGLRHHYIAPEDMLSPDASPLFGDFSGLPPLFFQSSESEMLRDDSLRAAERAHAAGVGVEVELWANVPHVFQGLQVLSHGKAALENIAGFVARHTDWDRAPPPLPQQQPEPGAPANAGATLPAAGSDQFLRTTMLPIE